MSEENEWLPEFVRKVFAANFTQDLDIAEPSVLLGCLNGLLDEPTAVLAAASGEHAKSCLRRNTERAIELGIFGAPTFVVGDELFWGNDRLEAALEWSRAGPGAVY
jgi:2-hydroxychromene-2-carboxylate isomerase